MRFFFYGTLMDEDVRRAVLGPRTPTVVQPAAVAGWRRAPVTGESFPIVLSEAGARVEGVLVRGLDHLACRRLSAYEGADYGLVDVTVDAGAQSVAAMMFATAGQSLKPGPGVWDFEAWKRRYKRETLAAIARAMASVRGG